MSENIKVSQLLIANPQLSCSKLLSTHARSDPFAQETLTYQGSSASQLFNLCFFKGQPFFFHPTADFAERYYFMAWLYYYDKCVFEIHLVELRCPTQNINRQDSLEIRWLHYIGVLFLNMITDTFPS